MEVLGYEKYTLEKSCLFFCPFPLPSEMQLQHLQVLRSEYGLTSGWAMLCSQSLLVKIQQILLSYVIMQQNIRKRKKIMQLIFFLTGCGNCEKACYTEEETDFTHLQEATWLIKACPFCKASAVQSLISLYNSSCLAAKTGRLKPSDLRSLR